MSYATEHASALADVRAAGRSVTFTVTTRTQDRTTGLVTPVDSTVTGAALRVKSDPKKLSALSVQHNLSMESAITLLFVPDTYGGGVDPGASVEWMSKTYIVRDVDPLAPDGSNIFQRVVVSL